MIYKVSCVSHVDDFFWGGSQLFKTKVIEAIKRWFQISQEESIAFTYVGLEIKDNKDGSGALWQGSNSTIENYGFLAAVPLFERVLQSFLTCPRN